MKPKITIVTVCFNCEDTIINTIESVINQNYENIEYIIIDGNSKDKTLEIIKRYANNYDFIKYISENDRGIYDAMNKSIQLATGEYIHFLNSGDIFCNNKVINNIFESVKPRVDIIYGNVIKKGKDTETIVKYSKLYPLKLLIGRTICHQAIFLKTKLFVNRKGFDLDFKFASDYELLLYLFKNAKKFHYIDVDIVYYDLQGVSSNPANRNVLYYEYKNAINKNLGKFYTKILYLIKKKDNSHEIN